MAIGSTVLQNELKRRLPKDIVAVFPQGLDLAYATIPQISRLPQPYRDQMHVAFAGALRVLWQTMIAVSGVGLLTVLFMRELPMHTTTDEKFGFEREVKDDVP